jgi:hypothetical protein
VTEQRETLTNEAGEATGEKVVQIEKLVTKVAVTHPDGRIDVLSSASEVGDFITRYSKQLCDALLARNVPHNTRFNLLRVNGPPRARLGLTCPPYPVAPSAVCSICKPTLPSRRPTSCAGASR